MLHNEIWMNDNFSWMLRLLHFTPLNATCLSVKFLSHFITQSSSFSLFFLLGCFICFVMGSVPSKMCSGRLVNCASKAPMRGNGEIAHAGLKKLAGPVAQLVIIVHLTAASQSYR